MKIQKKLAAAFTVLAVLLNSFPVYAMDTLALPEENMTSNEALAFSAKIEYSFQEAWATWGRWSSGTASTWPTP